jgi:chromosome segregation ATPase
MRASMKQQEHSDLLKLTSKPLTSDAGSDKEEMLVLQERLTKAEQQLETLRQQLHAKISELAEVESQAKSQEFDIQKFTTQLDKEREEMNYKNHQLKELNGIIEQNQLLMKERNDFAMKLNSHKGDDEATKAENEKMRGEITAL